jgi:hypothetical protein
MKKLNSEARVQAGAEARDGVANEAEFYFEAGQKGQKLGTRIVNVD